VTDFIWVASFPKSGSTWMRFILSNLLFKVGKDKDRVREMVPNIHDWEGPLKYDWKGAYPAKTHLAQHNLPERMHTRSAIYIIRNPLDVVDSSIAYLSSNDEEERQRVIDEFCRTGSIEPWNTTLGYESWESNIASWTGESRDHPLLIMQYEDMLADPHENVGRVAHFLDVDVNDKRIEQVVKATSFSSMKKQEKKEVDAGAKGVFTDERLFDKKDFSFMRSGKAGGYSERLDKNQVDQLISRFGATMEPLGYL
jgi:hypothetical protein